MRIKPLAIVRGNEGFIFLICVLTASLSLNVALGLKLKQFALELPKPVGRPYLQVGIIVPAMPVTDAHGDKTMLRLTGPRPTVIYVWRPSCVWCMGNLDNIRTLALATKQSYRFIGIIPDSKQLEGYPAVDPLPFPVYALDDSALASSLGLDATPQTALINSQGTIKRLWLGAYKGTTKRDIEAFFNVKLPGFRPVSNPPK